MRRIGYLTFGLLAAAALAGSPAHANMCRTDHFTCVTAMPTGGYCECTSHGTTESGDSEARAGGPANAGTGGCGAHPNDPGCRNERGR